MFDANLDLLNPTAWNAELLANDFPLRPALAAANTEIAGINIAGQFAARNETVKVHKADKPTGDANEYAGSGYSQDTPTFSETTITMDKVYYRSFTIDKWDQNFALPDLVSVEVLPRIHNILDTINKNKVKPELAKFATVVGDYNTTDYSVIDDTDLRQIRRLMLKEQYIDDSPLMAVIDPDAEFDLVGLDLFKKANERGNNSIQLSGSMGTFSNMDFFLDNNTYSPSNAGAKGNAVVASAASIGDTVITIDNGSGAASTCTLAEGDIVAFAGAKGRNDHYVVKSSTSTSITLYQGLRSAVANNATIDNIASANAQFVYDPDSIVVVTALPAQSRVSNASGVTRIPFYEPTNKCNFLISIEGDTAGAQITIETLVGAKNFYPTRGGLYLRGEVAK